MTSRRPGIIGCRADRARIFEQLKTGGFEHLLVSPARRNTVAAAIGAAAQDAAPPSRSRSPARCRADFPPAPRCGRAPQAPVPEADGIVLSAWIVSPVANIRGESIAA